MNQWTVLNTQTWTFRCRSREYPTALSSCVVVTMRPQTLETYSDVVGVDVIWTHNISIPAPQGDPGVIDLWEQVDRVRTRRENEDNCSMSVEMCCTVWLIWKRNVTDRIQNSQGRIFLYLFLLLFSGLWPSSLLFFTFASDFWRACWEREKTVWCFLCSKFLLHINI